MEKRRRWLVSPVIRLPHGVGVVAQTAWAAFAARHALIGSVTWSRTGVAWGFDSDKGLEAFAADARNLSRPARDWSAQGNARGEFQNAASLVEGEYLRLRLGGPKSSAYCRN
jgi:isoquinoline 1-oxidoreductase beta subunit